MATFVGIDVGTSAAKALICDENGKILATATSEYPLFTPHPGWSEQLPDDWVKGAEDALQKVLSAPDINPKDVKALGLTGQMHGSVFLDKRGEVIRPAILWNDQRTAMECEHMTAWVGADRLIQITGNPALTGFQAPKLLWLRNNEAENYERIEQLLLPKDYLRYRWTDEFATDASDAAGTLLLDLRSRDWSPEILKKLEIPINWLPKVYEGPDITGYLRPEISERLGLPAQLPVIAGGGDNAAAAVGTGVVTSGIVSSSIGTSGVLFAHSDQIALDPKGRLHGFCHAVPGRYHLMAVMLSAGGSLQWLRNILRPFDPALSYDQLAEMAERVPPGSEGLVFLPYLTGERTPHLDPFASGAFVGLTARHTLGHMVRAVMEGVVFAMRDGLEIFRSLGIPVREIRATGGGAKSLLWRQLQADIYATEVVTLAAEEGPAYGAGLLAGVGAGCWTSVEEAVKACVQPVGLTEPSEKAVQDYDEYYATFRDLYPKLKESMKSLHELNREKV